MLGNNCRYFPTCSQYFIDSLKEYGFLRIKNHQTMTGYIVKTNFLKTLIPCLTFGLNMMLKGGDPNLYANDRILKRPRTGLMEGVGAVRIAFAC